MYTDRMTELFIPALGTSLINSQYGKITWEEYLGKEKQRIENGPNDRQAEIRKDAFGSMTLMVNAFEG